MPPSEETFDETEGLIALPAVESLPEVNVKLKQLIDGRRTLRSYSRELVSLKELSFLLWATQGIQETDSAGKSMRTVPSAGGRHTFETRLLVNTMDGVEPGMYRYCASEHALLNLAYEQDRITDLIDGFRNIILPTTSAVTFMWICHAERMTWKFGERGYRYILLDAGHICQNLYLAAESIGCGVCAIGSFDDEEVNSTLGLDGETTFLAYAASVGKRA